MPMKKLMTQQDMQKEIFKEKLTRKSTILDNMHANLHALQRQSTNLFTEAPAQDVDFHRQAVKEQNS